MANEPSARDAPFENLPGFLDYETALSQDATHGLNIVFSRSVPSFLMMCSSLPKAGVAAESADLRRRLEAPYLGKRVL
jgi:hypothetical protein